MKNLFMTCAMLLFIGTAFAQQTAQKPNTTKIVSDPTAHPAQIDTVKNKEVSQKNAQKKNGKKQQSNTTKIVSDPTANPLKVDTVKNPATSKKRNSETMGKGKKQQSNTTKIVSDPTAHPLNIDTIKNPVKK